MKNIRLLLGAMLLCALSSCELEPYELPAEEIYTRNFIKKFGLIDPNQVWSMAKAAEVTIIPDGHADRVRVFGEANGQYYLTADITDVDKQVTVPIDLPQYVENLKVEIDGKPYYTRIGEVVDASKPSSRQYVDGNIQGAKITVSDCRNNANTASADCDVVDLPVEQLRQIFALLNEHGPDDRLDANNKKIEGFPGNLYADGIHTDFLLNSGPLGKELTVFPLYWNTCQTHTLGIYYFNTNGANDTESSQNIVRIPFYTMNRTPEFDDRRHTHKTDESGNYIYMKVNNEEGPLYDSNKTRISPTTSNIIFCGNADGQWWNATNFFVRKKGQDDRTMNKTYSDGGDAGYVWDGTNNWKVSIAESEAGNFWENAFVIELPKTLNPTKQLTLRFKAKADVQVTGARIYLDDTSRHSMIYLNDNMSGGMTYNTTWTQYEVSFTPGTHESHYAKYIVFSINQKNANDQYANSFYFDDIELYDDPFLYPEQPVFNDIGWNYPYNYKPVGTTTFQYQDLYYPLGELDNSLTQTHTDYKDMSDAHLLINTTSGRSLPLAMIPNRRNESWGVQYDNNVTGVHSKGIHITIPANTRYGFYLKFNDMMNHEVEKYIYSEVKGNHEFLVNNKHWATYDDNNPEDRRKLTYCAMFDQTYGGKDYTYLTFEDWTPNNGDGNNPVGDYDLNDLAFMVMGVNLDEEIEKDQSFEYIVCAEDLGVTDDFDFNDMIVGVDVLTVGSGDNMYKSVTFHALAGGGTLPLYLHLKYRAPNQGENESTDIVLAPDGTDDGEWHRWFGVANVKEMINTQNGRPWLNGKSITVQAHSSFTLQNFGKINSLSDKDHGINGIYITVDNPEVQGTQNVVDPWGVDNVKNNVITPPQAGAAPQMFIISDVGYLSGSGSDVKYRNWQWPAERSHIFTVFPAFENWVKDASNADWYKAAPQPLFYTKRPR